MLFLFFEKNTKSDFFFKIMLIIVNFLNGGKSIPIYCSYTTRIIELKSTVANKINVKEEDFDFFANNQKLDDSKALNDYGIIEGHTINVELKNHEENKEKEDENSIFSQKKKYIMNLGFSEQDAEQTLKLTNESLHESVNILQKTVLIKQKREENEDETQKTMLKLGQEDDDSEDNEWTDEEDSLLLKKFLKYGNDWEKIKTYFPKHSVESVYYHWTKDLKARMTDKREENSSDWKRSESELLINMWRIFGEDWELISKGIGTKTKGQVCNYWSKVLKPKLMKNGLTA